MDKGGTKWSEALSMLCWLARWVYHGVSKQVYNITSFHDFPCTTLPYLPPRLVSGKAKTRRECWHSSGYDCRGLLLQTNLVRRSDFRGGDLYVCTLCATYN